MNGFLLKQQDNEIFQHILGTLPPWNQWKGRELKHVWTGKPWHEVFIHPGIPHVNHQAFIAVLIEFEDYMIGNFLGSYLELITCTESNKLPIVFVFPQHYRDLTIYTENNKLTSIEYFIQQLPVIRLHRRHHASLHDSSYIDYKQQQQQQHHNTTRLIYDTELVYNDLIKSCSCKEYCWEHSNSKWYLHVKLVKNILSSSFEKYFDRNNNTNFKQMMNIAFTTKTVIATMGDGYLRNHRYPVVPDVLIHFRCSDIVRATSATGYGFLNFNVYLELIPRGTRLVYILSDPVHRGTDGAICGQLIEALIEFLSVRFPSAEVLAERGGDMIRNFAQIAFANTTICSASTFCLFPALASNGTAYFPRSQLLLHGNESLLASLRTAGLRLILRPALHSLAGQRDLGTVLQALREPIAGVDLL